MRRGRVPPALDLRRMHVAVGRQPRAARQVVVHGGQHRGWRGVPQPLAGGGVQAHGEGGGGGIELGALVDHARHRVAGEGGDRRRWHVVLVEGQQHHERALVPLVVVTGVGRCSRRAGASASVWEAGRSARRGRRRSRCRRRGRPGHRSPPAPPTWRGGRGVRRGRRRPSACRSPTCPAAQPTSARTRTAASAPGGRRSRAGPPATGWPRCPAAVRRARGRSARRRCGGWPAGHRGSGPCRAPPPRAHGGAGCGRPSGR